MIRHILIKFLILSAVMAINLILYNWMNDGMQTLSCAQQMNWIVSERNNAMWTKNKSEFPCASVRRTDPACLLSSAHTYTQYKCSKLTKQTVKAMRRKNQLRTKKILHVSCIIPIEIAHWTVINKWFWDACVCCVRMRTRSHKWSWNFLLFSVRNAHLLHWNALAVSANQFDHFNTNIFVVYTLFTVCSHVCAIFLLLFRSLQSASHHRISTCIYRIIMPIRLTALFHLVCNLRFFCVLPRAQKNCNHFINNSLSNFCPQIHTDIFKTQVQQSWLSWLQNRYNSMHDANSQFDGQF